MGALGANRTVRDAIVAGIFYPDDAAGLIDAVDDALCAALGPDSRNEPTRPIAIVSPHAAFEYACDVQAAAWASAARGPVDRVVIVAPLRRRGESAAYLPESDAFRTPLGDIEVDTGACADLESCNTLFSCNDIPHLESHAIEVQLPFMRRLFPEALLVPILVADDSILASGVARAIDLVLGDDFDRTLLVASANLASSIVAADAARRSDDALAMMQALAWRDLAERSDIAGATAVSSVMAVGSMRGARYRLIKRIDSLRHGSPAAERIVNYAAVSWYPGAGS
ncbi:MAG: AmmeMemoRadiSam system protein B [Spirochaetes bacterium]|nr:AmmeMemoRadiSam system protein B [Spirochaetota bacterium]MBU1080759.1 AmmeMemoRadiSam system protein B [Spirochaetota bacterium]